MLDSGFNAEDVITPFPRPMVEYELGLTNETDTLSLPSIVNPTRGIYHRDNSFMVLRLKALTLLGRAMKLRRLFAEDGEPIPKLDGSHLCAQVRTPRAFDKLKFALDHYMESLPGERRPPWNTWDAEDDCGTLQNAMQWETGILVSGLKGCY